MNKNKHTKVLNSTIDAKNNSHSIFQANLKDYQLQCKQDSISKVKKSIFQVTKVEKELSELNLLKENLKLKADTLRSKLNVLNEKEKDVSTFSLEEYENKIIKLNEYKNNSLCELNELKTEVRNNLNYNCIAEVKLRRKYKQIKRL